MAERWRAYLQARMQELGLTQEALAERVGVSQGAVGHWINARRSPGSITLFRRLEDALELPPGALLAAGRDEELGDAYPVAFFDLEVLAGVLEGLRDRRVADLSPREQAHVFAGAYALAIRHSRRDSDEADERDARARPPARPD